MCITNDSTMVQLLLLEDLLMKGKAFKVTLSWLICTAVLVVESDGKKVKGILR